MCYNFWDCHPIWICIYVRGVLANSRDSMGNKYPIASTTGTTTSYYTLGTTVDFILKSSHDLLVVPVIAEHYLFNHSLGFKDIGCITLPRSSSSHDSYIAIDPESGTSLFTLVLLSILHVLPLWYYYIIFSNSDIFHTNIVIFLVLTFSWAISQYLLIIGNREPPYCTSRVARNKLRRGSTNVP